MIKCYLSRIQVRPAVEGVEGPVTGGHSRSSRTSKGVVTPDGMEQVGRATGGSS